MREVHVIYHKEDGGWWAESVGARVQRCRRGIRRVGIVAGSSAIPNRLRPTRSATRSGPPRRVIDARQVGSKVS